MKNMKDGRLEGVELNRDGGLHTRVILVEHDSVLSVYPIFNIQLAECATVYFNWPSTFNNIIIHE